MIVTKNTKTFFKVEMTERQRQDLILLLETCKKESREFIGIQSEHGKEVADEVAETCDDLLESLKGCRHGAERKAPFKDHSNNVRKSI